MELALYKGDRLVGLFDSYKEVSEFLGIKQSSVRFLATQANFKRTDTGGRTKLYNYSKHDYRYYEALEEQRSEIN